MGRYTCMQYEAGKVLYHQGSVPLGRGGSSYMQRVMWGACTLCQRAEWPAPEDCMSSTLKRAERKRHSTQASTCSSDTPVMPWSSALRDG